MTISRKKLMDCKNCVLAKYPEEKIKGYEILSMNYKSCQSCTHFTRSLIGGTSCKKHNISVEYWDYCNDYEHGERKLCHNCLMAIFIRKNENINVYSVFCLLFQKKVHFENTCEFWK